MCSRLSSVKCDPEKMILYDVCPPSGYPVSGRKVVTGDHPEYTLTLAFDDLDLLDLGLGQGAWLQLVTDRNAFLAAGQELLLERVDRVQDAGLGVVVELLGLTDGRQQTGLLATQVVQELLLEGLDVTNRDVVKLTGGAGPDDHDLLLDGHRGGLLLLEQLDETSALGKLGPRGGVEVGGEHRERLHGAELGEVELEPTGHALHRLDLRRPTDAGDRDAHVDSGTHVGVEQVGLQVDLTVGDRDDVGRDVGRDITRLGLD